MSGVKSFVALVVVIRVRSLSELSSGNPLEKYFQFYSHDTRIIKSGGHTHTHTHTSVTHSNTIDGQTEELVCRGFANGLLGGAHLCRGSG